VIDSSVYYLKAKLGTDDRKVQEHLDRIKSGVNSCTAIIESLLNLTRTTEPRLERCNVIDIVSDSVATSRIPSGVDIVEKFPVDEAPVDCDREQLRMAFKNIIKNAIEAMTGKGTLTIAVSSDSDRLAEISFADTGPGISAEDLEAVFQPLFSDKARGMGFGLSITRMVVDRHSGTVEARSETGKGAEFVVRIPLSRESKGEE
jgi:two-component system sensor kinase FixL